MRELDRIAIESGLSLLQMMENAAIQLSEVVWTSVECARGAGWSCLPEAATTEVALATARHLANRGTHVTVVLDRPPSDLTDAGRRQLAVLEQAHVPVSFEPPSAPEAVIDGLIGYGLRGNPQDQTSVLIEWANKSGIPVCSLDLPSGLDADTGVPGTPCVRASLTLTLALPKTGLFSPTARAVTGTVLLADISIPAGVYESLGLARPDAFSASPVIEIAG